MNQQTEDTQQSQGPRKVYVSPAIVQELQLETRAGSPLAPGLPDPANPLP